MKYRPAINIVLIDLVSLVWAIPDEAGEAMENLVTAPRVVLDGLRKFQRVNKGLSRQEMSRGHVWTSSLAAWTKTRGMGLTLAAAVMFLAVVSGCTALTGNETARRASEELSKRYPPKTATEGQRDETTTTLTSLDWDTPEGHFFTQTNGRSPGTSATGFSITNREGVLFWEKFKALGGTATLGFPLSQRFDWKGRPTQVFHRGVLQWDPVLKQALPVNLLDELSYAGKDDWLRLEHSTPHPFPGNFDGNKPREKIVGDRLALLRGNKAIERYYTLAANPVALYGLPTSKAEDMGRHVTIRFQRAVIREWKEDWLGFKAGDVVVENVGEWAVESGILPPEAFIPETPPSATSPTPADNPGDERTTVSPKRMFVGNTDGMGVYIRRTPRMDDKIRAWPDNTVMQATGKTTSSAGRSWVEVRDPAGNRGWVPEEYLLEDPR